MDTSTLKPPRTNWSVYHRATRSATYGFLSALPLLVLYEALIAVTNAGHVGQVRVGAEVWLRRLLVPFGGGSLAALIGVTVFIGAAVFWMERNRAIPLRAGYFGWMIAESAAYAVVLAFFVSGLVGAIFAIVPAQAFQPDFWAQLALSLGAGLFEELVFRVLLVGGLYLGLRRLLPRVRHAYLAAAVVGALLFSAVHYVGLYGDAFTVASFAFRFFFGLALNALFLWRGFGVAAWTHALYDVLLTLGLL